ncbi:hypothetical protein LEP1GSC116_0842 [Leptospira interrogans serovar Icterohaemorrhagiae str. Verdun HP]|uniref:UvrA interaction domain-containing protein n=1 Tax=Leptospira interrogans serovar Icterohaemorrhagiae str. Verdun HP TaxID=1049910 RepID=M6RNT9_LEPIR|nr:hypothetical protein LEP1GSC116_0842 [Leptospira interrogans serovar Icterohaemorrhagiae str. Verdun HP]
MSIDQITARVLAFPQGSKLQILAPVISGKKGEHKDVLEKIRKDGFNRVRINGEIRTLEEEIVLKRILKLPSKS